MRSEGSNGEGRQVIVFGDPEVNANVARVVTADPGPDDQTTPAVVFRFAGSVTIQQILSSIAVYLQGTAGTIGVDVGKIQSTVAVYIHSTSSTINVDVGKIRDTIAVYLHQTAGTLTIRPDGIRDFGLNSVLFTSGDALSNTNVRTPANSGGTRIDIFAFNRIFNGTTWDRMRGGPGLAAQAVRTVAASDVVASMKITEVGAGLAAMNIGASAQIFTVSGSTSGISASGVQLIAPSAAYSFKIFAFSLQTTAQVGLTAKFVNGAGAGQTEFWRPLITASGVTGAQGANLAVMPPGFLFATGVSTTLALLLDTASLVHYSVSYIKESA